MDCKNNLFYYYTNTNAVGRFFKPTFIVLQVGVGFLAQYFIKPLLGFAIATVSLDQLLRSDIHCLTSDIYPLNYISYHPKLVICFLPAINTRLLL